MVFFLFVFFIPNFLRGFAIKMHGCPDQIGSNSFRVSHSQEPRVVATGDGIEPEGSANTRSENMLIFTSESPLDVFLEASGRSLFGHLMGES